MKNYNKYQVIATILIGLFIVNFSLCVLAMDKKVYERCYDDYMESMEKSYGDDVKEKALSRFEATQNYSQLAEGFTSFFKSNYANTSYEISSDNIKKLNKLKIFYRLAWIVTVICAFGIVKCFIELSRIRQFMPIVYGGLLATGLTVLNAAVLMLSKGEVITGVRNMILHGDYTYFADVDLIRWILPPDFGLSLAITYLIIVFGMIVIGALVRGLIIFCGRPHKF